MSNYIGLDNILRDKESGKLGGEFMEILATVQSLKQARRLQDEIAIKDGMIVVGSGKHSGIYRKIRDGVSEELTIEKKATHQWQLIKTMRQNA